MAVVRTQRQVNLDRLPGVRLTAAETADSTGATAEESKAAVGRAIAGLGATAANIGIQKYSELQQAERDRADSVAILAYQRQYGEWENKYLFDRDNGAMSKQGKDSFGLPEQTQEEFTKVTGDLDKTLTNERQRTLAERFKADRAVSLDLTVRRHVLQEQDRYEGEELKGHLENLQNSIAANANDPKTALKLTAEGVASMQEHLPKIGLGPEAVQQRVMKFTSGAHEAVINQLLSSDQDKAAKVYFEQPEIKAQIDGDAQARIERALEEGSIRGESQQKADAIIATGGTLTEQRTAAKNIDDPKVRERVLQLIEHEDAVNDKAKRDADEALLNTVYDKVRKSGGNLSVISPAEWQQVGSRQPGVRAYADSLARGIPTQTDASTFYNLMEKARTDPDAFLRENLLDYRHKLDDGDFNTLTHLRMQITNGQRAGQNKELEQFSTNKQLIDSALSLYNVNPNAKPNSDEGRAIAQLHRLVGQQVDDLAARTGKKPQSQDVQEIIDRTLGATGTKKGSWWNIFPGGQPFWDEPKRLIDFTIADVPADQVALIKDALRRRQRTITDQTIVDTYILKQLQGGQK